MKHAVMLSALTFCIACSASPSINVGNEVDGAVAGSGGASGFGGVGGIAGGDDTLTALITEPPSEMAIEVIAISCAGECKQVLAVAHGGNDPYTFAWNDGVTAAAREICADEDTSFTVTVTDTGFVDDEFAYEAQTAVSRVTANVLACPGDAGVGDGGIATTIDVPGIADLWLVDQPDGTRITNIEGGSDVAPMNSPVELPVMEGATISFAVTGSTSNSALPCGGTPDGGCSLGIPTTIPPTQGLAGLSAPINSLIGVFLDAATPIGPAPASLDATITSSQTSLSPLLAQPFFIGDGLTGTGSGAVQQFTVPQGATRLLLASLDAIGGNYNNIGQFDVAMFSLP